MYFSRKALNVMDVLGLTACTTVLVAAACAGICSFDTCGVVVKSVTCLCIIIVGLYYFKEVV